MPGKAKADYGTVFRTVLDQLPIVPAVESITADFEVANWRQVLPNVQQEVVFLFYASGVAQDPRTWDADPVQSEKQHHRLMAIPFLPAADIASLFSTIEATYLPELPSQLLTFFK